MCNQLRPVAILDLTCGGRGGANCIIVLYGHSILGGLGVQLKA